MVHGRDVSIAIFFFIMFSIQEGYNIFNLEVWNTNIQFINWNVPTMILIDIFLETHNTTQRK